MHDVVTLVLAGGRGIRLRPLSSRRAKPVVPFAGGCIIDFTLQNCARSGMRDVIVLTQYRADDVARHVASRWESEFDRLTVLSSAAVGRPFSGTADAARAALERERRGRDVLVLASDHVYRMDYRRLLADHVVAGADATLSVLPVARADASRLGVVGVGANGRIESFVEKPPLPPVAPLASMGVYCFDRRALEEFLASHQDAMDFGRDVVPGMLQRRKRLVSHAYHLHEPDCYWRDIADVDAYHAALMDHVDGRFALGWSAASDATVESGAIVERSVVGRGVHIARGARVRDSVLLDGATVGAGARLQRVVVEEGGRIAAGRTVGSATQRVQALGARMAAPAPAAA